MSEREFLIVFSKRLKHYLSINNMSQKDLAEKLGVGTTSVYNWINGIKAPRMDKVDAMCALFNCRRSDLLEENNNGTYYLNAETARIAQEVFEDPDLRILFDAARDSKPENIQFAADMLRRMKDTNPDD